MQISARNAFEGIIKSVTLDEVNAEVILTLTSGLEVVSVITRASAERLGLKPGKAVFAVVKSSDVMIGVNE
jgi:molybdopterin-binding protein